MSLEVGDKLLDPVPLLMRLLDLAAILSLAMSRIACVVGDVSRSRASRSLPISNLGLASVVINGD